jgi:competence protein ComEA
MTFSRIISAAALSALLAGSALAQTATQPPAAQPARPAAATPAAPATATRPAATAPAAQPQAARVNLNSATAAELDGLPQIGAARAQTIITERGKGRFRDWADFERRMAGTSVNQQALNAIKERVRF